jgi:hypothetical protein
MLNATNYVTGGKINHPDSSNFFKTIDYTESFTLTELRPWCSNPLLEGDFIGGNHSVH